MAKLITKLCLQSVKSVTASVCVSANSTLRGGQSYNVTRDEAVVMEADRAEYYVGHSSLLIYLQF